MDQAVQGRRERGVLCTRATGDAGPRLSHVPEEGGGPSGPRTQGAWRALHASDRGRRPAPVTRARGGRWTKRSKDAGSVACFARERPGTPARACHTCPRRAVDQAVQGRRERGVLCTRATGDAGPRLSHVPEEGGGPSGPRTQGAWRALHASDRGRRPAPVTRARGGRWTK